MNKVKKNRYGKDMVTISLNVPVRLLVEFDCMADFLQLNRSEVIISALSDFEKNFSYNSFYYTRNTIKRIYRREHKK